MTEKRRMKIYRNFSNKNDKLHFLIYHQEKVLPYLDKLTILSVLSDKAKQSNELQTWMQRKHHLFPI